MKVLQIKHDLKQFNPTAPSGLPATLDEAGFLWQQYKKWLLLIPLHLQKGAVRCWHSWQTLLRSFAARLSHQHQFKPLGSHVLHTVHGNGAPQGWKENESLADFSWCG